MKNLGVILFALCIICSSSADIPSGLKKFLAARDSCMSLWGLDRDSILEIFTGDEDSWLDNHDFLCFLKCIHEKLGFMNGEGRINVNKIKKAYIEMGKNADEAAAALEECKDLTGDDACETAGKIIGCLVDELSLEMQTFFLN